MAVTVAEVMRQCRNYFEVGYYDGTIAISGNAVLPKPETPWCCVKGSMLHDGVYECYGGYLQADCDHKPDEEFEGRLWLLNPPPDFLSLCKAISDYDDRNPPGAFAQERFGEYSYMRNMRSGADVGWQSTFKLALTPYRRMFSEVM